VGGSGRDLNAYAKVENQAGCCSPSASALSIAEVGCCSTTGESSSDSLSAAFHERVKDLLSRHNVNDYAASVRVFAVKP
jgi:arsenite methyltransferase